VLSALGLHDLGKKIMFWDEFKMPIKKFQIILL